MQASDLQMTYKTARRIVVTVIGVTVLLIGVALMVLPGPAVVVIPIGLGILGLEYAWARRWLKIVREQTDQVLERSELGRRAKRYMPDDRRD